MTPMETPLREAVQVPRNKARSTRGLAPRPMIVVFGLRMRLCTCMASYGASLAWKVSELVLSVTRFLLREGSGYARLLRSSASAVNSF